MKGIVLAGGLGTRLAPITASFSKQLLPVYDKPMIYYPISVLLLAGISEILVISTPRDTPHFRSLLGDGSQIGCSFEFAVQNSPNGLAESFIIAEEFIGSSKIALILGDNIFFGAGFSKLLQSKKDKRGATIFAYAVEDPSEYGVVSLNEDGQPSSLEEKPKTPSSNYAVTGLYFYENQVVEVAKSLSPSSRGELEITDVNREFLRQGSLDVAILGRGFAWFDAGNVDSLNEAGNYVRAVQNRQGFSIGCIEEIAFRQGWINREQLFAVARKYPNSRYGNYLMSLART